MNKFKECNQCPHEFNDKNLEPCKDCVPKKKTNADRIRAMSDEELARYFAELIRDTYEHEYCDSEDDWLIWLQSEAEKKGE